MICSKPQKRYSSFPGAVICGRWFKGLQKDAEIVRGMADMQHRAQPGTTAKGRRGRIIRLFDDAGTVLNTFVGRASHPHL
jgi:hypothetical protein